MIPLQLILFGFADDLYLDLSNVKKNFLECITVHDSALTSREILDSVYESRGSHTHPSMLVMYLADRKGSNAWKQYSESYEIIKERDELPFLVLITHDDYTPFHPSLLPQDEFVHTITREEFEKNEHKICYLANHYMEILSLSNPDDLYLPGSFERVLEKIHTPSRESKASSRYPVRSLVQEYIRKGETIPCFNIKAPSMIIPTVVTAERMNSPVILEVSPSEVLRYYPHKGDGIVGFSAARRQLFQGLRLLKESVDFAIEQLNPSVPIFLHLDHATSPEVVMYCMDIGYDMVMYDGTHRSFNSNMRTTTYLTEEAHKRGIPLEAEFSSVDRSISKTTDKEKAATFLERTKADLLGVSVGQKHGSDYGFENLLKCHTQISYLHHLLTGGQSQILLDVIQEILKQKERALDEEVRLALDLMWQSLINHGEVHKNNPIYFDFKNPFPFSSNDPYTFVALDLWKRFLSKQKTVIKELEKLFEEVINISFNFTQSTISRQLDWMGIDELQSAIKQNVSHPCGLVVHGGSSIDVRHLNRLHQSGVVKINFGSSTFKSFLQSLLEHQRPYIRGLPDSIQKLTLPMVRKLLDLDWRDRHMCSPEYIQEQYAPFIDYLERFYFKPIMSKDPKIITKMGSEHVETIQQLEHVAVNI